ncbi:MAG: 4Fe-4S dicluster domain-containing protein [Endomicrobiia bacterium]|nr:4Fe-4S dicluster domain-containing protein [Endomicrobiia bacterium]
MKKIYAKPEYCMACRLCEIACFVKHSKSKKIIKAFREERGEFQARIIVEQSGPVSFALQCRHCEDAGCIEACLTGAMTRNPDGAVVCDENKCVGCWSCIMVCPYGVINHDRRRKKIAAKCDLCPDKNTPACVEACPNEALVYE